MAISRAHRLGHGLRNCWSRWLIKRAIASSADNRTADATTMAEGSLGGFAGGSHRTSARCGHGGSYRDLGRAHCRASCRRRHTYSIHRHLARRACALRELGFLLLWVWRSIVPHWLPEICSATSSACEVIRVAVAHSRIFRKSPYVKRIMRLCRLAMSASATVCNADQKSSLRCFLRQSHGPERTPLEPS